MKLLMLGDVFGEPGRNLLDIHLLGLRQELAVDYVIVNGENAAHGRGITEAIATHWFDHLGIDVITTGNHAFDVKGIDKYFDREPRILRPLNYPPHTPGHGAITLKSSSAGSLFVLNIMGRVHMPPCDDPFRAFDQAIAHSEAEATLVDMHAEATSEMQAMGWHADGRAAAVLGTHTHVPTLDLKILPGGTAFVSDIGMTGPYGGVIGMDKEASLDRFYTGRPTRFSVAQTDPQLHAIYLEIQGSKTVKAHRIIR